jgi:hypothetical protein
MTIKKKITSIFAAFVCFFIVTASAYAESSYALLSPGDDYGATGWIGASPSNTLHIRVTPTVGTVNFEVRDNFGNFITGGTATPSSPKYYPRNVPDGLYYLEISCVGGDHCSASASLSD